MKTIPPDLIPALVRTGFRNFTSVERGADISAPPSYRIAYVCQCSFHQVFLIPITLCDRSIQAGQCPKCGMVHWAEWVSKEERIQPIVKRF